MSQVVSAEHVEPFHNRLTHTFKVAQLGLRIAQFLRDDQKEEAEAVGLDPEVVEAACLIHDLGHPPFGHVGEEILNEETVRAGDSEGYEGNAQAFRIVTKLALRSPETPGLDLTRAVLAASVKYPWEHAKASTKGGHKFGCFRSEREDFQFARQFHSHDGQTIEAAIMDYADDIAYSVHDLEDFHRIRAVPWHILQIQRETDITNRAYEVLEAAERSWRQPPEGIQQRLKDAANEIINRTRNFLELYSEPYEGTRDQRVALRNWTSDLIRRYVRDLKPAIEVRSDGQHRLIVHPAAEAEIRFLKQLVRSFVIEGPVIGAQQKGQQRVVRETYADLVEDVADHRAQGTKLRVLPVRFHYLLSEDEEWASNARIVADTISGLTEKELIGLHSRLRGLTGGSISDPIVR